MKDGIKGITCEKFALHVNKRKDDKEMELKINEVAIPEQITFNYEELKAELTEKASMYETLVYTDDQIKEAKADKAALNKLKKALNDERIRREKEYMQPFNDFKVKINEIIGIIDKPVAVIDKQVKEYEDKQKQDKLEKVKALWSEMDVPDGLTFEKVFDDRMLNVSYNMAHVKQKMLDDISRFNRDIATLSDLPEFGFEAVEVYKSTLDVNKAITEAKRMSEMAKAKAAHEAEQKARAEEQARLATEAEAKKIHDEEAQFATEIIADGVPTTQVAPEKQWISFRALLSVADAQALAGLFAARNIEFEQI